MNPASPSLSLFPIHFHVPLLLSELKFPNDSYMYTQSELLSTLPFVFLLGCVCPELMADPFTLKVIICDGFTQVGIEMGMTVERSNRQNVDWMFFMNVAIVKNSRK